MQKTLRGKCSLERSGTTFYLHFQMVIQLQAKSMVVILMRSLKGHLGWDKNKPPGGMVMYKALASKGFNTFYGMIG